MGKEIKIELGTSLQDVIKILREYREKGEYIWCLFNDYKLTSYDSFDEIYIKVFGFNKKNYDLKREQFEREYIESEGKRKLCMQYNINFWIKEGKKVIITEKHDEWERCVKVFANNDYYYLLIDDALDIMYELEAGCSLEDARQLFASQKHSGNGTFIVKNIVFIFSKRGKEFLECISNCNNKVKRLVK